MNPLSKCEEAYKEKSRVLDEYGRDLITTYQVNI